MIGQLGGSAYQPYGIRILGSSGVTSSVTGTTSETQLANITIPANSMGENGKLRVTAIWSFSGSNNKTLRVKHSGAAGTVFGTSVQTTNASAQTQTIIGNAGVANAQRGYIVLLTPYSGSANAIASGSADTTVDTTIYISGQLANTGETITLESYSVELIPGV